MGLKLSPTTFATGINDKLAPVDIYTQKSAKNPIDAITLDINLDPTTIKGLMGGNLGTALNVISSYSKSKGITINASALLSGIIGSNPTLASAMGSLNQVTSAALTTTSGFANITATIGSISSKINNSNLSNLTAIASLIGGISGTAFPVAFTDIAGLTNLSVNLLKQANTLGIPNAYTQIANGLGGNLPLLQSITKAILPSVVHSSNVNMLSNIAQGPVTSSINASNPAFIASFASNYTLPPNTPQNQLPLLGAQISTSFTAINPSWNTTTTHTGTILNKNTVMAGASVDFATVMAAAQATANVPAMCTPTVTIAQTAAQATANPLPSIATGSTSSITTSVNEPDGTVSSVLTTTWPDGMVITTTTSASGTVTSTTSYPIQPTPNPQPATSSNMCMLPVTDTALYTTPTSLLTNTQVVPFTSGITNLSTATFPQNSISTTSVSAGGTSVTNTALLDGSNYSVANNPTDTTTTSILPVTNTATLTTALSSVTSGDPLASTCTAISSSPLAMGAVMNDLTASSTLESISNGTVDLMSANASEALAYTMPNTALTGLTSFTQ